MSLFLKSFTVVSHPLYMANMHISPNSPNHRSNPNLLGKQFTIIQSAWFWGHTFVKVLSSWMIWISVLCMMLVLWMGCHVD